MSDLRPSTRAPGLLLGEGVTVPEDAQIGGHVVLHSGVRLGAGCTIQDGAVVGKPLVLSARSMAPRGPVRDTVIGDGAAVCAGAVIVAGAEIGANAIVGDQANVRDGAVIDDDVLIGQGCAIGAATRIGARSRLQTRAWITTATAIEEDVFVGPGAVTMNDNTMGRLAPGEGLRGVTIRRAARVGGAACLLPGVEVGEEAFVAAGSIVTRDVPPRTLVLGAPARAVREVPAAELLPT